MWSAMGERSNVSHLRTFRCSQDAVCPDPSEVGFAIQPIQEILTEDHRRAKIGPIRQ